MTGEVILSCEAGRLADLFGLSIEVAARYSGTGDHHRLTITST